MNSTLRSIQKRIDAYERSIEVLLREFHDEPTMNHFSDRFGLEHPLSQRADRGTHLMSRLKRLHAKLDAFAEQVLEEFPDPNECR